MRICLIFAGLALAACGSNDRATSELPAESSVSSGVEANLTAPPVVVDSTKSFTCDNKSTLKVEFMSDEKSAVLTLADGQPVKVTGAFKGVPMNGAGWILRGSSESSTVRVTPPGDARTLNCTSA